MARGVADAHSMQFKARFARVVLASLIRQQHDRLRHISRGRQLSASSLLTRQQASVLLSWYGQMKRDHASAMVLQGNERALEQVIGIAATEVVGWDRTVPLERAFEIHFGKEEDHTKSQLDEFLRLPYAPAHSESDRHPDDVRIEFDAFLARAWSLWLLRDIRQDSGKLDTLARYLAGLAVARRSMPKPKPPRASPQQLAAEVQRERDQAEEEFKATLQKLESVPVASSPIQCLSDLAERARGYAVSSGARDMGPQYIESLIPDACYGLFGSPQEYPRLQDVKGYVERLANSTDMWASEVLGTLNLTSGARVFEAGQWIVMRGLPPLRLGPEIVVAPSMPYWLAQEPHTSSMLDAPPEGSLWLTTSVASSDSRMAAELAGTRFRRVLDVIAWVHRQPVISLASAVVVHDPLRRQILFPGFHMDERPFVSDRLSEAELNEAFDALDSMSRDPRPFVRSISRGIAIWRKALQLEDLECRFVELWRAFEAIVGPFRGSLIRCGKRTGGE